MCYQCNQIGEGVHGRSPFASAINDYGHNLLAGTSLVRFGEKQLWDVGESELFVSIARGERERARKAQKKSSRKPAPTVPSDPLEDPTSLRAVALRRELRAYLKREGRSVHAPAIPSAPVGRNLSMLADVLSLEEADRAILQFLLAVQHSRRLAGGVSVFGTVGFGQAMALIAAATGVRVERVTESVRFDGRLSASGLVRVNAGEDELTRKVTPRPKLLDVMLEKRLDRHRLLARFLPEAEAPTLTWDDYAHVAAEVRTARDLLASALAARRKGINVLLYGPTGTGKTELAGVMAKEIGARLFSVGRADDNGDAEDAENRLADLRLANRLAARSQSILLFDEAEDVFHWETQGVFGHGGNRRAVAARVSKKWFNDLLEQNAVPTVWVTNNVSGIDPAYLRRFAYAVELKRPGARQRAKVLSRHLGKSRLAENDVDAIARRFEASPAQLGQAVAVARLLAKGGKPVRSVIEDVLEPIEKLVRGDRPRSAADFDPEAYRLDVVNASEDLTGLVERLAKIPVTEKPGVSVCLYGPPGTGKSELVRYLAWRMGRRVVYRRVSDIQSMWVGESEKNIAEAFREAEADDCVLLFDEADSFLRDRREAVRSWEVTQVNEFLQQLETFRGVVACTTNLWQDLDPASLRRFVFKIELKPLLPAQSVTLFKSAFDRHLAAAPREAEIARLRALTTLTPGDIAAVARRIRATGERLSAAQLVDLVEAELRAKRAPSRSVGY